MQEKYFDKGSDKGDKERDDQEEDELLQYENEINQNTVDQEKLKDNKEESEEDELEAFMKSLKPEDKPKKVRLLIPIYFSSKITNNCLENH